MPKKQYPTHPSLAHFKHQAKDLLKAAQAGDLDAIARFQEFHPRFRDPSAREGAEYALSDAQLTIAREYDFASWARLRECMDAVEAFACDPHKDTPASAPDLADEFLRLACLNYGNDHPSRFEKARALWSEHPEIRGANIYIAAATGDVETARVLLEKDAGLAKRRGGSYHWEPILYAAYSRLDDLAPDFSSRETARLLLEKGADADAGYLWEGFYLFTALTGVFGEGERGPVNQPPHLQAAEFAQMLLAYGANPNDGQTLYNRMFTRGTSHLEILFAHGLGQPHKGAWPKRMGGKLDSPQKMLSSQLHWAASHGHLDRVRLMAANGVDLNSPCHGQSPYEAAVMAGHKDIAAYLLEHGAHARKLEPTEAFTAACMSGDRDEAMRLRQEDPAMLQKIGKRQIHLLTTAAGNHQLEAAQLMIDLGFDVSALGRNTALHEAAWAGDVEMIELLLAAGADRTIQDREHKATPLQWAEYNHQTAAADALRTAESGE